MSANEKTFRTGQIIFEEGQTPEALYILQSGTVSIRKGSASGYVEIAKLEAGQVFGELSFFDRNPRSATAVALNDVKVLEIDFSNLDKIYSSVPDYIKKIMECVAERLRTADESIHRLEKRSSFGLKGNGAKPTTPPLTVLDALAESDKNLEKK